jgi:hypothetical protein
MGFKGPDRLRQGRIDHHDTGVGLDQPDVHAGEAHKPGIAEHPDRSLLSQPTLGVVGGDRRGQRIAALRPGRGRRRHEQAHAHVQRKRSDPTHGCSLRSAAKMVLAAQAGKPSYLRAAMN